MPTSPEPETPPSASRRRGFGGLRVVTFESRMSSDAARLVHQAGGVPIPAPSMKEVPLEASDEAFAFGEALLAGKVDVAVFLTGVGTRTLVAALETRHDRAVIVAALSRIAVVARGPKPLQALRELGVPVAVTVPEPNTWRELLAAVDAAGLALAGHSVALQEYGVANDDLVQGLADRGARVMRVPVYRWAMPDDLGPLEDAVAQVLARTVDVMLFTSSNQAFHLVDVVRRLGVEDEFRRALREVVVGSVGPVCSESLRKLGFDVDLEPTHPKLGTLVKEASERSGDLVIARRRDLGRPAWRGVRDGAPAADEAARRLRDSVFLKACRREAVPHTPVWLMRQAGRYMQEYREVRARASFMELCRTPDLAAQVAVEAQERIGADAAILFSDILLILEPMGLGLDYVHGDGPRLASPVRRPADVDRLLETDPAESLSYVMDAVRRTRAALAPGIPLIGFSGAPFTLASYILEGGGSRNYIRTKRFMLDDRGAWDTLMDRLARAVGAYLKAQVEAGCQAVQLFDSWVGCLAPGDFRTYVLPHLKTAVGFVPAGVPVIQFGTDTATLLELQAEAGCSVIGVDHRVPLASAFERFPRLAVQGNLDPVVLFARRDVIRREAARVLAEAAGRPGHVFNLGHGILPATPVDNVIALVDAVHEISAASAAVAG